MIVALIAAQSINKKPEDFPMQFGDPRTDFIFARVFANEHAKEVGISFLNTILGLEGSRAIVDFQLLELSQKPRVSSLMYSFVYVKCRDHRGVEFIIAMQLLYFGGVEKRFPSNACKVSIDRFANDDVFPKLNQVIGITVLDFTLFEDSEQYLYCFKFKEKMANDFYLDEVRHYFIELPQFTKNERELETPIEKWCYFIKHAGKLQAIPEKLNSDPYLKAFELASRANMTKKEWDAFDATAVWVQDQHGVISAAYKEGLRQGRRGLAHALRLEKIDPLIISKAAGLSREEIEAL
jgi:predicted transposase/invertase (TIGR01784 family)